MFRVSVLTLFATVGVTAIVAEPPQETRADARRQAHAHNDYLHDRPLLDALDHGFGSVEADIYLVDGELLVAHTRRELKKDRTLRGLYLEPLRQRIKENDGSVHGDGQPLTLLIDIKSKGAETYQALDQMLSEYDDIFSSVVDGQLNQRAVNAVVSGNRKFDLIADDATRYVGIDGRLSDLKSDKPAHLMPLISDRWGSHFKWRGKGPMSDADREKLDRVVEQAHERGRKIRFWAIPDNELAWSVMQEAGVDLINTDNLSGLSNYLQSTK